MDSFFVRQIGVNTFNTPNSTNLTKPTAIENIYVNLVNLNIFNRASFRHMFVDSTRFYEDYLKLKIYYNFPKVNFDISTESHFPDSFWGATPVFNIPLSAFNSFISDDIDLSDMENKYEFTCNLSDATKIAEIMMKYRDVTDASQGRTIVVNRYNVPLSEFNETYFKTKQEEIKTSLTSAYWENNIDGFYTK